MHTQDPAKKLATQIAIKTKQVDGLKMACDAHVQLAVPDLTGCSCSGRPLDTPMHRELRQHGRRWAMHIMEAPIVWTMAFLYVAITVGSGYPLFISVANVLSCFVPPP